MADNMVVQIRNLSGEVVHVIDFSKEGSTGLGVSQRFDCWLRGEINAAYAAGGYYATASIGEHMICDARLHHIVKIWLLPEVKPSYGYGPEGQWVFNGGYELLFQPEAKEERSSVWNFEVPTARVKVPTEQDGLFDAAFGGMPGEEVGPKEEPLFNDETFNVFKAWWPQHVARLYAWSAESMTVVGQKVSIRVGPESWLGFLAEVKQSNKLPKRLKSLCKAFRFVASFQDGEVKVQALEDGWDAIREKCGNKKLPNELRKKLVDGLTLIDKGFYHRCLEATQLYLGSEWLHATELYRDAKDGIPEDVRHELMLVAQRNREEKINRAKHMPLGNLRIVMQGRMIKSNYLAVQGLAKRFGVDVLTSKENIKKEIGGAADGRTWVGIDPQKVHKEGTRTSIQLLTNNPGIFPEKDLIEWMEQALMKACRRLATEVEATVQEDLDKRDTEDISEVTSSILFRFREMAESVIQSGLTLNFSPHLMLNTLDAMVKRIMDEEGMRISIPIPCSMGMQVLSATMARLAGVDVPDLAPEEVQQENGTIKVRRKIWVHPDKVYAVVDDDEYSDPADHEKPGRFTDSTGGSDLDDHYILVLRRDKATGELVVLVLRHPNGYGEWLEYVPVDGSTAAAFPSYRKVLMKISPNGERHIFSDKLKDVPEVDLTLQPKNIHDAVMDGSTLPIHPRLKRIFDSKKTYPDGYTLETVIKDIEEAMEGHSPGLFINTVTACVMAGMYPDHRIPVEDAIDLMQQGGSHWAKKELGIYVARLQHLLLKHTMEEGAGKVDRLWATKVKFFLRGETKPEKDFSFNKKFLEDGKITRLFEHFNRKVKGLKEAMVKWLLHWQQHIPAWAQAASNWGEIRQLGKTFNYHSWTDFQCKTYKDFAEEVQPEFKKLAKMVGDDSSSKDAQREVYATAAKKFVAKHSILALFARTRISKGADVLIDDTLLWNGTLSDLVVDFHLGKIDPWGRKIRTNQNLARCRRPAPLDTLTFRLANSDAEEICRWLKSQVNRGEDISQLLAWLKDHGDGGNSMIKAMDSLAVYLPEMPDVTAAVAKAAAAMGISVALTTQEKVAFRKAMVEDRREVAKEVYVKMTDKDEGGGDKDTPPPPPPPPPADDWVKACQDALVSDTGDLQQGGWADRQDAYLQKLLEPEETQGERLKIMLQSMREKVLAGENREYPWWKNWMEHELLSRGHDVPHSNTLKAMWKDAIASVESELSLIQENMDHHLDGVKSWIEEFLESVVLAVEDGCQDNQELWSKVLSGQAESTYFLGEFTSQKDWDRGVLKDGLSKDDFLSKALAVIQNVLDGLKETPSSKKEEEKGQEVTLPESSILPAIHRRMTEVMKTWKMEVAGKPHFARDFEWWEKWLNLQLEAVNHPVPPQAVLMAMWQASDSESHQFICQHPTQERLNQMLQAVKEDLSYIFEGKESPEFEQFNEEDHKRFLAGTLPLDDIWEPYGFNHDIAPEITKRECNKLYLEMLAEYTQQHKPAKAPSPKKVTAKEMGNRLAVYREGKYAETHNLPGCRVVIHNDEERYLIVEDREVMMANKAVIIKAIGELRITHIVYTGDIPK